MWHFSPNGAFSTKSAYKVSTLGSLSCSSVSNGGVEKWWNCLWKTKIPNKIKMLVWRVFHDIIPSNFNLCNKNVPITYGCSECGKKQKTSFHTLFRCKRAKEIWNCILPNFVPVIDDSGGFINHLLILASRMLGEYEF